MSFYSEMADTALSLIAEFGRVVTITRPSLTIDPVTGVTVTGASLSGDFTVINPPASGGTVQAFDNRLMGDAALITDNLRFLIVAASGAPFAPAANDKIAMDGKTWIVAGVTPISPAGTVLVWKLGMQS